MTREEKDLLLRDLCARLPYDVKAQYYGSEEEMLTVDTIEAIYTQPSVEIVIGQYGLEIEDIKPYLRPLSSMTKEEKEELVDFGLAYWDMGKYTDEDGSTIIYGVKEIQLIPDIETYDWLNKKMFDFRGLIPKGHAIAVTEENNPYK